MPRNSFVENVDISWNSVIGLSSWKLEMTKLLLFDYVYFRSMKTWSQFVTYVIYGNRNFPSQGWERKFHLWYFRSWERKFQNSLINVFVCVGALSEAQSRHRVIRTPTLQVEQALCVHQADPSETEAEQIR